MNGSLEKFPEGNIIKAFLDQLGYKIIELVNSQLTDVGSVIFFD